MGNQLTTFDTRMVRGQTLPITFTVKDNKGRNIDITGAVAYMGIRADMKIAPTVLLASQVTSGYRVGIIIDPDQDANRGQFTATLIPSDTSGLVALGDNDPWLYDAWIVDINGQHFPVIATSKLGLYPEVTTLT